MNKLKKALCLLITAGLLSGLSLMTALADEETPIETVILDFSADADSEWANEVNVTTGDSTYYVDDVNFLDMDSDGYPQIKVNLMAEDGYYFQSNKKSAFSLSGEGAVYVSALRRNRNTTLILTVRLKDYGEGVVAAPDGLGWSDDGVAMWDASDENVKYEVKLIRSGSTIVDSRTTFDTDYDFSSYFTRTGYYQFRVRTLYRYNTNVRSEWVSSEKWEVDRDTLNYIRDNASPDSGPSDSGSDYSGPGNSTPTVSGGWVSSSNGWWFRNPDGSYPRNQWMQIGGSWYFFNTSGYMVSSSWIHSFDGNWYYLDASGRMATNTRTPDGYYVDSSGIRVSSPSGSASAGSGKWTQNSNGWKYTAANGMKPSNQWMEIDGCWYFFNDSGYMSVSKWIHSFDGNYYYVDASGRMVTNTRTPDGYYVDGRGIWIPGR